MKESSPVNIPNVNVIWMICIKHLLANYVCGKHHWWIDVLLPLFNSLFISISAHSFITFVCIQYMGYSCIIRTVTYVHGVIYVRYSDPKAPFSSKIYFQIDLWSLLYHFVHALLVCESKSILRLLARRLGHVCMDVCTYVYASVCTYVCTYVCISCNMSVNCM